MKEVKEVFENASPEINSQRVDPRPADSAPRFTTRVLFGKPGLRGYFFQ